MPAEEPAVAGIGCWDNRHLRGSVESICVNMGDPSDDAKESGSSGLETTPKTSDASEGSQRGHSTLRTGKPSTWGRATACQVRQSTTTPLYTRESWLGGGKETTVMVLAGGRRVR
jgi:hypothetical protein